MGTILTIALIVLVVAVALWFLAFAAAAQAGLAIRLEVGAPDWRDPEYGCKLAALRARMAEYPGRPLVVTFMS